MKYSDLIDIKQIINESFLEENYLASEYKWGFELEAFINFIRPTNSQKSVSDKLIDDLKTGIKEAQKKIVNIDSNDDDYNELLISITEANKLIEILDNYDFDDIEDFNAYFDDEDTKLILQNICDVKQKYNEYAKKRWYEFYDDWNKKFPNGDWQNDRSINPQSVFNYPFEWASPVLDFKPEVFKKVFTELSNIQEKYGIDVNDSCGFHCHISNPSLTKKDAIWILCKLSLDDNMIKYIKNFEGIEFMNYQYANFSWVNNLKKSILNKRWNTVLSNIPHQEKKSSIIMHKQGTLEWRGPRQFLGIEFEWTNASNIYEFCKKFIIKFYNFVKWMREALDDKNINGITREEFFNLITKEPQKTLADMEFKKHQGKEFNDMFNAKRLAIKFLKTLDKNIILNLPLSIKDEFIYYLDKMIDYDKNLSFKVNHTNEEISNALKEIYPLVDDNELSIHLKWLSIPD